MLIVTVIQAEMCLIRMFTRCKREKLWVIYVSVVKKL